MGQARPRGTDRACVIEVIETASIRGSGDEDDPVRRVFQYWSTDGKLLAENDERANGYQMTTDSQKDLNIPQSIDESGFYKVVEEEWSGLITEHLVRISVLLPYHDWCELKGDIRFLNFLECLRELEKQYKQNKMTGQKG